MKRSATMDKKADLAGPGIGNYEDLEKVLPRDYRSLLDPKETQRAIRLLKLYIEEDQGIEQIIVAGHDSAIVRKVARMVDRNEYKRRQSAPGVKITTKAFGRDRRLPITNGYQS